MKYEIGDYLKKDLRIKDTDGRLIFVGDLLESNWTLHDKYFGNIWLKVSFKRKL